MVDKIGLCVDSRCRALASKSTTLATWPLTRKRFIVGTSKMSTRRQGSNLRLIQTRRSCLRIPQCISINKYLENFLSLQKHNCLLQSAEENTACVNEPLCILDWKALKRSSMHKCLQKGRKTKKHISAGCRLTTWWCTFVIGRLFLKGSFTLRRNALD